MNLSRVIGPVLAGALLAAFNDAVVFALNAVLAAVAFGLVLTWRSQPRTSAAWRAFRRRAARRRQLRAPVAAPAAGAVARVPVLLQSTALIALLPLVARDMHGGGPATFTVMLACLGAGAIVAALLFPRWRARWNRDQFIWGGTLVQAALSVLIVYVHQLSVALPAMFLVGMAWDLGGQLAHRVSPVGAARLGARARHGDLPDRADGRLGREFAPLWLGCRLAGRARGHRVRGRGRRHRPGAVAQAAGSRGQAEPDYTPQVPANLPEAAVGVAAEDGPVMVMVEYTIDLARGAAFAEVMQRTRPRAPAPGRAVLGPVPRRGAPGALDRVLRRRELHRAPAPRRALPRPSTPGCARSACPSTSATDRPG